MFFGWISWLLKIAILGLLTFGPSPVDGVRLASKMDSRTIELPSPASWLSLSAFVGLHVVSSSGLVSVASTPYFPCSSSNGCKAVPYLQLAILHGVCRVPEWRT